MLLRILGFVSGSRELARFGERPDRSGDGGAGAAGLQDQCGRHQTKNADDDAEDGGRAARVLPAAGGADAGDGKAEPHERKESDRPHQGADEPHEGEAGRPTVDHRVEPPTCRAP